MAQQKKYEFVPGDEKVVAPGRTVKRIRALIEPGTPPAEALRVAADLEYQKHRESGNHHRALQLQVQQQAQGVGV